MAFFHTYFHTYNNIEIIPRGKKKVNRLIVCEIVVMLRQMLLSAGLGKRRLAVELLCASAVGANDVSCGR